MIKNGLVSGIVGAWWSAQAGRVVVFGPSQKIQSSKKCESGKSDEILQRKQMLYHM